MRASIYFRRFRRATAVDMPLRGEMQQAQVSTQCSKSNGQEPAGWSTAQRIRTRLQGRYPARKVIRRFAHTCPGTANKQHSVTSRARAPRLERRARDMKARALLARVPPLWFGIQINWQIHHRSLLTSGSSLPRCLVPPSVPASPAIKRVEPIVFLIRGEPKLTHAYRSWLFIIAGRKRFPGSVIVQSRFMC